MPAEQKIGEWMARVQSEYLEMPGMALNKGQMQRLWSLDAPTCDTVVERLLDLGFLYHTSRDTYIRIDSWRRR
jgi:hypothetical protein